MRNGCEPGDIVRLYRFDGDDTMLAVIRSAHPEHLTVYACHPYVEYASGADVIVMPDDDRRYPLVVNVGTVGCVWHGQVDRWVGRLPAGWRSGVAGTKLCGPWDARRLFLDWQRSVMGLFAAHCTAYRLDGNGDTL